MYTSSFRPLETDTHYFFMIYLSILVFGCGEFCCCSQAFPTCGEGGYSLLVVSRLFIAVASPVAYHQLGHTGFSNCSYYGLLSMWNLPGPGL